MRITAAVVAQPGGPFELRELQLAQPRVNEICVRIVAAGICRTDLHIRDREYPIPFPIVPGHEGAGVVEQIGSGVDEVAVGDHVLLSFPWCGRCRYCLAGRPAYCRQGFALSFGGQRPDGSSALTDERDGSRVNGHIFQQSCFASHVLAPARSAVRVPKELALEALAPLACGVQTGAGAVWNTLRLQAGQSLAVFGAGGVGLSAVLAAKAAGAGVIMLVDLDPARLKLGLELGASHAIDPAEVDLASALAEVVPDGLDAVIETTAVPGLLTSAVAALDLTGTVVLLGAAAAGTTAQVDMNVLLNGRTIRGSIQGDSVPRLDIPRLIGLGREGGLPIERMIQHYDFADIETAVADMAAGHTIKPVLRFN